MVKQRPWNALKSGFGRVLGSIRRGLGRSGLSFGHFWTLFGFFFGCSKSILFHKMGSEKAFSIEFASMLEDSGRVLEGFWRGLGRDLEGFPLF